MHYFLALRIDEFWVSTLRNRLDLRMETLPLAVHHEGLIVDAEPSIAQKGIRAGISLKTARAISDSVRWVEYRPEDYRAAAEGWHQVLLGYADQIEIQSDGAALIDLSSHTDPAWVAEKLVFELREKFPNRVNWGLSNCRWIAELSCARGMGLVVDAQKFISRFSINHLPLEASILDKLRFLGYQLIADLGEVPLASLKEYFGEQAVQIYQMIKADWVGHLAPNYPPQSLSARIAFEGELTNHLQVEEGIVSLSNNLGSLLLGSDSQSAEVQVFFEHEASYPTSVKRIFRKPVGDGPSLAVALRLMLTGKVPEGTTGIRVYLHNVLPANRKQLSLVETSSARQDSNALRIALQEVKTSLGTESIYKASEVKLTWHQMVMKEWKHATGWR